MLEIILQLINLLFTCFGCTYLWLVAAGSKVRYPITTRMWANAQRDGRPAEHRWRPLFNAAKFGWRSLLDCCVVTLPRRETGWNLLGCPKLTKRFQPLVGRTSPYCEDINKFFSNCWYVPSLRRYRPTTLCNGAQKAIFGDFFGSCISSKPRAAHFRPAF